MREALQGPFKSGKARRGVHEPAPTPERVDLSPWSSASSGDPGDPVQRDSPHLVRGVVVCRHETALDPDRAR